MPTNPPTISPAPQVPQRGVKATFGLLVDAFNTWKANSVAQFAAVALNTYNNAVEAFQSAQAALNWAGVASDQAAAAAGSAVAANESVIAAAAINGASPWVAGTTYQQYARAVSKVNFKTYTKTTTAATSTGGVTDPANDSLNWQPIGVPTLARSARTVNTQLVAKDAASLIDITAGTFTQTLAAATTLGAGWYVYFRNAGNGDITIDPNGVELIDGVTSGVVKPGMLLLIQCDGAAFTTLRMDSHKITEVKTSGTSGVWPLGVRMAKVRMTGGGSGGRLSNESSGTAAGYLEKTLSTLPGQSYTYSVGAAGQVSAAGGTSTFTHNSVTLTANGGPAPNQYSAAAGGTATGGDINIQGGTSNYNNAYSVGGSTPLGQGATTASTGYGAGGAPGQLGQPGVIILEY